MPEPAEPPREAPDPWVLDPEVVVAARSLVRADRQSLLAYWLAGSAIPVLLMGYQVLPAHGAVMWFEAVFDLLALVYGVAAAVYFGAIYLKRRTSRRWLVSVLTVTDCLRHLPKDVSIVTWASALVKAVDAVAPESDGRTGPRPAQTR